MSRETILVSACLLGEACRWNGAAKPCEAVRALAEDAELIPICPEVMAGLPTPRPPCEILDGRVYTKEGRDITEAYLRGAALALSLAREKGVRRAILCDGSPSCGVTWIYDGSFSGKRIGGQGLTAKTLRDAGLAVQAPKDLQESP